MRTHPRKYGVVSLVTGRGARRSKKAVPIREMEEKLTISDTIALAALIGFALALSHAMPTVYDNQKDRK